jgi:hypothetical protein
MNRHHFVSSSSADAQDFALRHCEELAHGPPTIQVWLDKHELVAGSDWDDQIVEAIRDCASVIFLMTRGGVTSKSVCKKEWTTAYRSARATNKDAGNVERALRLFDALAVVDSAGVLKDVRTAAARD